MSAYPKEYQRLLEICAGIDDLKNVLAVLNWDERTQMPKSGASARADHKATIGRLLHERVSSPELGKLLEKLEPWAKELPYDSDEAGIIRVARRNHLRAVKTPEKLVVDISRARSEGYQSWLRAREAKDYKVFAPSLRRIYHLHRELAEALGYEEHPLDALLDQSEPGMKTREIEKLFQELRETLVPLVKKISEKGTVVSDAALKQPFDTEKQWEIGIEGVKTIGFCLDEGRMDISVHPFTTSFSPKDVRITTRIKPNEFGSCFFACLHEAGHGHYCQGIPVKYRRTPLAGGASSGMHESQSRTWENLVGRSKGFWENFYPKVQKMFPEQTKNVSLEDWYRAVNCVRPSLIRVEADEVTYNLHIMVRFELEKAVYDGKMNIDDLAEAWNAKFQEYLGIAPENDLVGVLQDIHWSGRFGASFVSYTLGNVISVQLYEAAIRDNPELKDQFARGDYSGLLEWSRRNIHAHGSKYQPKELVEKATGKPLSTEPYLRYITRKFSEIYEL